MEEFIRLFHAVGERLLVGLMWLLVLSVAAGLACVAIMIIRVTW